MSIAPDQSVHPALKVAVIGAGYWGPNLARNFAMSTDWDLDRATNGHRFGRAATGEVRN